MPSAAGLLVMLLGGCPALVSSEQAFPALPPGIYFVEARSDGVYAYLPPRYRGGKSAWLPVDLTPTRFQGPGVYQVDENGQWSHISEISQTQLDALIQVHDPAPLPVVPTH
jgi:hypothetical protein